jgi:hypothetical protein
VENHVVEEVPKLRNRELNIRVQASSTRLHGDFVILKANRGERFEMRIHEEDVRTLDIHERRRRILDLRVLGAHTLDLQKTLVQQGRSHEHAVLFTIIGNKLEDTSRRHCNITRVYYSIRKFLK